MHRQVAAILCLLVSSAHAVDAAREFGSGFYTGLSMSVVQVRLANAEGKRFFGSGVVVGPNEVVTNCHVTRNAKRIEVAKGALVFHVFGQKTDIEHDLCLLRTEAMPLRVVQLRDSNTVKPGEHSFFYGYSGGVEAFFAPGRVATLHPHDGAAVFETSSGFALGGSGGGLFDSEGRLIGITTFLAAGHSGGYFAMPTDFIHALRKQPEREIAPVDGLALWEKADRDQPWFLRVARLTAQSRWPEAGELAVEWTRAEPDNADAWHQAGVSLLRSERAADALALLQRADALHPDHPDILFHMALAQSRAGTPEGAREARDRLARADASLLPRLDEVLGCSAYC
ncbi:MAG: serine protease [Thauera sp.]|nr:MAG: serine protease [Thauera sp.]